MGNGLTNPPAAADESFAKFFEYWLGEQRSDLEALVAATESNEDVAAVGNLVARVVGHYEYYYRAKAAEARRDVIQMFAASWESSTEKLFAWAGGWRPSAAIQLLYSKSGLQLEPQLDKIIRGVATGDLAELSPDQLERVDQLHRQTIRREREIAEEEAAEQEKVAGKEMVEISHVITEAMGNGDVNGGGEAAEEMEGEMKDIREGMESVLGRADQLRMETIKRIVEILRPMQAAHFLIAAAKLHLCTCARLWEEERCGQSGSGGGFVGVTRPRGGAVPELPLLLFSEKKEQK